MSETYRIVIADDEAIICMDLKEILEEAGHEVVSICADGVRALELVRGKTGSRDPRCTDAEA